MEKSSDPKRNFLKLPSKNEINLAFSSFSKGEWIFFTVLFFTLLVSTIFMLENINRHFMVRVPMRGGNISEGVVGAPRFVNPVLAFSDADLDLSSLIYSGLMRKSPDGTYIPDLAESYTVSPDGLTYTFTLKDKIYFQDGSPVTADDVLFTIAEARDPVVKSPRGANWDGASVTKLDEKTIQFSLKQPFASFLDNTTIGILPQHIWGSSPIELNGANTSPVGSGPYMVSGVSKESNGVIDDYVLSPFDKFALGKPYIGNITLRFYPNEDAMISGLESGEVDQISSITPEDAQILKEKGYQVESSVLPRVFGLFFNQNQNQLFTDKNVVSAINEAVDKNAIVEQVLGGYGVVINSPIPPNLTAYQNVNQPDTQTQDERTAAAENILAKDGWVKGADGFLTKTTTNKKTKTVTPLQFSISTGNAPELAQSAELIKEELQAIGMQVDVKTFEVGNLNQGVIRPRKYDVLLFGEIINNESDLFAFWDSSQRKDPGLNVAMYTNANVDKLLEAAAITVDPQVRMQKYVQVENDINKDVPAVFLYSPNFIYIVSKNLEGVDIGHIATPADRFSNVWQWYTETDNVWKIFAKQAEYKNKNYY